MTTGSHLFIFLSSCLRLKSWKDGEGPAARCWLMLQRNGGPCFRLPVKWLNWCQSPRDKGLLLWNTATQALSSLKPGGTAGVCWWMRTKPWHNNTKWCLGWQKLICACSQKAMINDGEQGNAVPPFCSSLMGIEKQKKKRKKKGWFLLSLESGGHPEYITAILLLLFPQAGGRRGVSACNEFWNDSLTLWAGVLSRGMWLYETRTCAPLQRHSRSAHIFNSSN